MLADDKVKENRLRRVAQRRGLVLQKSRRRDPRAMDFGGYMLADARRNVVVAGAEPNAFSMSLDDVQRWLDDDTRTVIPGP
jgi:hypothetical protein